MTEVEPLIPPAEHVTAYQFLERLGGRVLVEAPGAVQEWEVERASEHGGHRGQLACSIAEALEPAGDELAHARGQRPCPRIRDDRAVLEGARRLDHHEGVALARAPHLLGEPRQGGLVPATAREDADQSHGLGPRQGSQLEANHVRGLGEISKCLAQHRGIDQLILPGRRHHHRRPGRDATRQEGQQPDAHLIGPVHVLEDQEQWPHPT